MRGDGEVTSHEPQRVPAAAADVTLRGMAKELLSVASSTGMTSPCEAATTRPPGCASIISATARIDIAGTEAIARPSSIRFTDAYSGLRPELEDRLH
jgi:hypothetical protein